MPDEEPLYKFSSPEHDPELQFSKSSFVWDACPKCGSGDGTKTLILDPKISDRSVICSVCEAKFFITKNRKLVEDDSSFVVRKLLGFGVLNHSEIKPTHHCEAGDDNERSHLLYSAFTALDFDLCSCRYFVGKSATHKGFEIGKSPGYDPWNNLKDLEWLMQEALLRSHQSMGDDSFDMWYDGEFWNIDFGYARVTDKELATAICKVIVDYSELFSNCLALPESFDPEE